MVLVINSRLNYLGETARYVHCMYNPVVILFTDSNPRYPRQVDVKILLIATGVHIFFGMIRLIHPNSSEIRSVTIFSGHNFSTVLLNILIFVAVSAVAEAELIVREAVEQSSNPHHLGVTCTAGSTPSSQPISQATASR